MTDSSSPSPATSDAEPRLARRDLLAAALGSLAAAALGTCALAGCTSPPRSFRAPRGRVVRIPLERYPELETDRGVVKVLTDTHGTVFVRRVEGGGGYEALSATCTHQGCTVAVAAGGGFRCPCHGSTYDRDGQNTGGPAPAPLERYEAVLEGGEVVVNLGSRK